MKRIFRSLAALLIIAISFSAISFAWLAGGKYLNFPSSFGGSAVSAYFAGGDGSEKNPFIIKNSVHLYNLAWLQYLGYFNQREGFNNGRDQTYFALGSNVDMKGRAIPPIGTEQYPFIGNFNGNGHTVKKLTVSNKRGTGDLVYVPTNANFSSTNDMLCHVNGDNSEVEIVGMFGVTGNYNGYLDDYVKTHADLKTDDVSVSNFYVDKIHVRSNSAKTLAGLAAGYIGGNFSNVGVYRGDLNFAANAQANGVAGSGILSKYSLVGAYNEDLITWDDNTGGTTGWGNSIGIKSLYDRLGSFYDDKNAIAMSTLTTDQLKKDFKYYYNIDKGSLYVKKSSNLFYLKGGTADDTDKTKASYTMDEKSKNYWERPTYLPIKTKSDTDYTVADDNTGYMAGGPLSGGSGDIRVRSDGINSASASVKVSTNGATNFNEGNNVEILTITKNTYDSSTKKYTLRRILDEYNKDNTSVHSNISTITKNTYNAEKYSNPKNSQDLGLGLEAYHTARKSFNDIIKNQAKWYGFHFMNAAIGINNTYFAPKVTINGKTYTTDDYEKGYQMTADSIDFQTQSKGHIAFFAASNFTNNNNFFSLHEIFRTGGNIETIKEISKIYSVDNNYVYLYSNGTVSSGKVSDLNDENLEFDCGWINNTGNNGYMKNNAIYYFEIPVNKGEFALGSVYSEKSVGGYLLYLDIGANGDKGPEEAKSYTMDKVRFVNSKILNDDNSVTLTAYDPALITLSGSSTAAETAVFQRDEDETDGKLKLAYRIIYNNTISAKEVTTGMTREDSGLQKSNDEKDD